MQFFKLSYFIWLQLFLSRLRKSSAWGCRSLRKTETERLQFVVLTQHNKCYWMMNRWFSKVKIHFTSVITCIQALNGMGDSPLRADYEVARGLAIAGYPAKNADRITNRSGISPSNWPLSFLVLFKVPIAELPLPHPHWEIGCWSPKQKIWRTQSCTGLHGKQRKADHFTRLRWTRVRLR